MKHGSVNIKGTLKADVWVKVYETTIETAVDSLTISGLNGDVDIEYRLIVRQVEPNTAGTDYIYVRPNNDSGANYGFQNLQGEAAAISSNRSTTETGLYLDYIAASSASITFSDLILQAKTGAVRTAISKHAVNISGATVTIASMKGQVWNNSVNNITSLVLAAKTNGLGIGTYVLLMKKAASDSTVKRSGNIEIPSEKLLGNCFETIYETTLTGAATSLTITGLDGDTDVLYELENYFIAGADNPGITLEPNDDASNQGFQYFGGYSSSTVSGRYPTTKSVIGYPGVTGRISLSNILFFAKTGSSRSFICLLVYDTNGTTISEIDLRCGAWSNTATNITSLVVDSDAANGLGIGTYIRLKALKHST